MDIQKAKHLYLELEKKKPSCLGKPYLMLPKKDGWYGYIDSDDRIIRSRAKREIPSCKALAKQLAERGLPNGRLIFEIMVRGVPQFEELNGILNRKEICDDVYIAVHDFIPVGNNLDTLARYAIAEGICDAWDHPAVELIPSLGISDVLTRWNTIADQQMDKGEEGLILKSVNDVYHAGKRDATLLKIKEECSFELRVVGMRAGMKGTKYQHTLGTLVVMDATGKKFRVSGMSDEQRDMWYRDFGSILHKVVQVKAKNVMKDGSLREGRFKAVRFDKDEIDEVK